MSQIVFATLDAPLGSPASPFGKQLDIDLVDRSNWDSAIRWLQDEAVRYVTAVSAVLHDGEDLKDSATAAAAL